MEKTNTIATMKALEHNRKQSKFGKWWKTKAWPWLKDKVISKIPSLRTILLLVILVYMANNGALKDMPNTQWMVECAVRLIEWIFGVFRWVVELFVGLLDSKFIDILDILGIFELLSNFMKMIFAL